MVNSAYSSISLVLKRNNGVVRVAGNPIYSVSLSGLEEVGYKKAGALDLMYGGMRLLLPVHSLPAPMLELLYLWLENGYIEGKGTCSRHYDSV